MNTILSLIVIIWNICFALYLISSFQANVTFVKSKEYAKRILDQINIEECSVIKKKVPFTDAYVIYCNNHRFIIFDCDDHYKTILEKKSIKINT